MSVLRPLLILMLVVVAAAPSEGARRGAPAHDTSSASTQEVLKDFETILDLWRDGRYDELYQRTNGGKDGREKFANRLASAPRKPACCWEKIQEARVSLKSAKSAVVQARLGFEGSTPGTEFVTKAVHLKKEASGWSIAQSELYSLADLSSKRRRYKYLPIQPKK
ncbi:hypothetical protein KP003_17110 [Geomonas nitrogeniifigens]|uniref:SnoaL-like domain-containing protein n=1 Tax=Geomonas diazotrophica TaxID=2843197 RepID=A0ABX8JIE9_9BACT|nr:hypothetical protein [Geomonas nitrogeniifigens]QWV96896.1 hypothetical protein KP005_16315 [Geomonas nitrogeniifigens]QXE86061.1 hypothetical protein KP003_17110 [Geomonas nitrogeniifigens]